MSAGDPAFIAGEEVVSHAAFEARVAQATGKPRALGVKPGERGPRGRPAIRVGRHRAGRAAGRGRPGTLNTRLADPEIAWQLDKARVSLVIAGEEFADRPIAGRPCVSWRHWLAARVGVTDPVEGHDDPARDGAILFTSGTTGGPRARCCGGGNLVSSARASAMVLPLSPGDRWLASLPFFHVGGLGILVRCALAGACVVLPRSFSAADLAAAIDTEAITHASLVEATLRRVLESRGGRPLPATLRAAVIGGGRWVHLLRDCPQALASYGLTESCAMVALERPGEPRVPGTSGRALPGVELRIADDGVIEVRGSMVMRGYLDDEAASAAVLREGWLRTGDLGELDAGGQLRVLSRREDLIVSGGENVYPAEIAQALAEHPAVAESVVFGVPDATWGEVPLAVVVLRAPGEPDLRAFLEARLARYKLPRIVLATEIPHLANGKPDRAAVRARILGGR